MRHNYAMASFLILIFDKQRSKNVDISCNSSWKLYFFFITLVSGSCLPDFVFLSHMQRLILSWSFLKLF